MGEQRLARRRDVARDSGLGGEALVGGDVLNEAEQLGRERPLRECDWTARPDSSRQRDDVGGLEPCDGGAVPDVHDVDALRMAGERRDEADCGLAVERTAALLE